jgi:hypothetical protein
MPALEVVLKILLSILAFFTLSAIFFALIFLANHLLRVRADRKHTIRLENRGNCRSMYFLTVTSAEPSLRFSFFLKNVPLAEVVELEAEPDAFAEAPVDLPAASVPSPAAAKNGSSNAAAPSVNTASAAKTGQAAAAKAGTVASFLGGLGQLLPGSLGAGLRASSAQAREVQSSTSKAVQAPQTLKNQVGSVQKDGSRLVGAKSSPQTASPARAVRQKAVYTAPAGSVSGQQKANRHVSGLGGYRVQTPELAPGQFFDLTLQVGKTTKRYPAGSFAYLVQSQQVALDFPDLAVEPLQRSAVIHFGSIGAWRYWLPAAISLFFVLLGLVSLVYTYLLIWQ